MFDKRYGTGQSTMDGVIRSRITLIAGSSRGSPALAGVTRCLPAARGMGAM